MGQDPEEIQELHVPALPFREGKFLVELVLHPPAKVLHFFIADGHTAILTPSESAGMTRLCA